MVSSESECDVNGGVIARMSHHNCTTSHYTPVNLRGLSSQMQDLIYFDYFAQVFRVRVDVLDAPMQKYQRFRTRYMPRKLLYLTRCMRA